MDHLPYIAASYAAFLAVAIWLAAGAGLRLRRAQLRLRAVDRRAGQAAP